jgi:hypothetical protein
MALSSSAALFRPQLCSEYREGSQYPIILAPGVKKRSPHILTVESPSLL